MFNEQGNIFFKPGPKKLLCVIVGFTEGDLPHHHGKP